jgi:Flp pilus assembly protein TadG
MRRLRDERGQALVLLVLLMIVFIGLAGVMVDVGHKFASDRKLQGVVDAAALDGAQDLPECGGDATSAATASAAANNLTSGFTASLSSQSTIDTAASQSPPVPFSTIFGLSVFNTAAQASATADPPSQAKFARPIVFVTGDVPTDCSSLHTHNGGLLTIQLKDSGPGTFGLIDFTKAAKSLCNGGQAYNCTAEQNMIASWIRAGYCPSEALPGGYSTTDWTTGCTDHPYLAASGTYPLATGLVLGSGTTDIICAALTRAIQGTADNMVNGQLVVPVGTSCGPPGCPHASFTITGWAVFRAEASSC